MKIKDIITESGMKKNVIDDGVEKSMSNTFTMPDQNMYHGSAYKHSQFMKAIAGAGAGNVESMNLGDENWAAGNPVASPYHPIEEEMIDNAATHVGDHSKHQVSREKASIESPEIHRVSPTRKVGAITKLR